jgi:hypothetical protein
MEDQDKVKFIELSWDEILTKLTGVASKSMPLKCWIKNSDPVEVIPTAVEKKSDHILVLTNIDDLGNTFGDKEIMLNFQANGVDYFTTALLFDDKGPGNGFALSKSVYKAEKRTSERLLAFPHHQIYVYFKFELDKKTESNIISLNKYREENSKIFEKFSELKAKQELSNIDELKDFTGDKLMGFRVLDLSLNGVSFLSNETEAKFFGDKEKSHDLVVLVNGESFRLDEAKLVYKVDYLNPRANSVSMYKVGFQFDDNKRFKESLTGLIASYDNLEELKSEFELFIDI